MKKRAPNKKPALAAQRPAVAARTAPRGFGALFDRVATILDEARSRVVRSVNSEMVLAYWHIGRELVEHLQRGGTRADYGNQLVEALSKRLTERFGRGFSTTNLRYFRSFYLAYPKRQVEIRHIGSGESGNPVEESTMIVDVSPAKGRALLC